MHSMTYTFGCLSHVFDLKTLDEVLGQRYSLRQTHANVTGSGPVSGFPEKGAGRESNLVSHVLHSGSRMLFGCLETVVMQKRDRRRYDQRLYGALPLSYGPAMESSWAGGTRTHDTRLLKHVLRIGSRSCAIVISVSSSKSSATVSTPRDHCLDQAGRVGFGECRRFWCRPSVAWCKRTAGKRRRL